MKITIEPTTNQTVIDGVPFRIWAGTDENGTEVNALVRAVSPQTHDPELLKAYERELKELPPLKPAPIMGIFCTDDDTD